MLGNMIAGFIVILVGTSLLPTVAQQVGTAQADGNVTGAADTLIGLTTLFYALAIATSAIAIASIGLRNSGMM
jgi:xanthine/uracil permease